MKDQLISLETAKLAKEKGFDIACEKLYKKDGDIESCNNEYGISYDKVSGKFNYKNKGYMFAPTQSLLQKWLRDKHKIHIDVYYNFNFEIKKNDYVYRVSMPNETSFDMCMRILKKHLSSTPSGQEVSMYRTRGNTYEEALELALQEALQLIKK